MQENNTKHVRVHVRTVSECVFAPVPRADVFGWRDKLLGGCSGVVSNLSRTMLLYHDRHLLAMSDFYTNTRHVLLIGVHNDIARTINRRRQVIVFDATILLCCGGRPPTRSDQNIEV